MLHIMAQVFPDKLIAKIQPVKHFTGFETLL
jgi:hypothetical protein